MSKRVDLGRQVPYDSEIKSIELSLRLTNILERAGITTLPALAIHCYAAMARSLGDAPLATDFEIKDLGPVRLAELEDDLADFGWTIPMLANEYRKRLG